MCATVGSVHFIKFSKHSLPLSLPTESIKKCYQAYCSTSSKYYMARYWWDRIGIKLVWCILCLVSYDKYLCFILKACNTMKQVMISKPRGNRWRKKLRRPWPLLWDWSKKFPGRMSRSREYNLIYIVRSTSAIPLTKIECCNEFPLFSISHSALVDNLEWMKDCLGVLQDVLQ